MSDEVEKLKAELAALQATIEQANEALAPIDASEQQLTQDENAAYEAYMAERERIRKKREHNRAIADQMLRAKNQALTDLNYKNRLIAEAEAKAKLEAERAARQEALLLLNDRWDMLTLGAKWREFAKDHQIQNGHFLTENRNVILADPMGLGKTLSAIITTDMAEAATRETSPEFPFLGEMKKKYDPSTGQWPEVLTGAITRPVGKRILYFCPSSLIRNVMKEYLMWAKHRNVTFVGGMPKASRDYVFEHVLKDRADFVVICNYEAWRKDLNLVDQLIALDPDTVILDEAHNIKDMKTSAFKGIDRILKEAKPEYILPMTGTPILNRPQELFTLLHLVNPEEFYREADFLMQFCQQNQEGKWIFQAGGMERIAKRIRKNFRRTTKEQAGLDLPPLTVVNHDLEPDTVKYAEQARVRKEMKEFATIMIDKSANKTVSAAAAIAVYTRLRQIETWPAGIVIKDAKTKEVILQVDVEESQKIDYIISPTAGDDGYFEGLIPEVIEDERMVLFSQFKAPLHEIKRRVELAGYRAAVLDGSVPSDERERIANDFDARYTPDRSKSKYDIVLCNYRVGGVGLNFTAATQLIVLDEEWNPGKRDQAYGRIDRLGQTSPTTVHLIRAQKTVDEWLAEIMDMKEDMVDGFNTATESMPDLKDFLDDGGLL